MRSSLAHLSERAGVGGEKKERRKDEKKSGKKNKRLKKKRGGAGEMAQWLRALTALPEVLSSIPSNSVQFCTTICNGIWCPLLVCLKRATVYSYIK